MKNLHGEKEIKTLKFLFFFLTIPILPHLLIQSLSVLLRSTYDKSRLIKMNDENFTIMSTCAIIHYIVCCVVLRYYKGGPYVRHYNN